MGAREPRSSDRCMHSPARHNSAPLPASSLAFLTAFPPHVSTGSFPLILYLGLVHTRPVHLHFIHSPSFRGTDRSHKAERLPRPPQCFELWHDQGTPHTLLESPLERIRLSMSTMQGHIQLWQERATSEPEQQAHGQIAGLFDICYKSLRSLIKNIIPSSSVTIADINSLRRSYALLRLWAEGHGVTNGTLDATLDRSKDLRQTTLSVLVQLCRAISQGRQYPFSQDSHADVRRFEVSRAFPDA